MRITSFFVTLVSALIACAPFVVQAAPPYNVTATITAPTTGGPVSSYTLYLDNVAVGPVTVGVNMFPNLLPADGTYSFHVRTANAAGTADSPPVVVAVSAITAPGPAGISIQIDCSPCVITTP